MIWILAEQKKCGQLGHHSLTVVVGIQFLFLVGGFAESPLLQMEIRKEFSPMLKVIIPQDVGLSILKGK